MPALRSRASTSAVRLAAPMIGVDPPGAKHEADTRSDPERQYER